MILLLEYHKIFLTKLLYALQLTDKPNMDQATHNRIVFFIWGTALREALGDNIFRECVDAALKKAGNKFPSADLKLLPYTPDAWIKEDSTKIGYEVSFPRYFYKPQPLRTLEEIRANILAVEKKSMGFLKESA